MLRKNKSTRTRALIAAKLNEVRLEKANLLKGSQWKAIYFTFKQEINDLEPIQVTSKIKSGNKENKKDDKSSSAARCQTPIDEEQWVVRRQLCRGCHSEGAFWSLETTTEGDTYGDLLQKYFNIQLCPVSKNEHALSRICELCATRLREARAFSAQARAAEERFTRLYKQNRIREIFYDVEINKNYPTTKNEVFLYDVEIKEDIPKVKNEVDVESDTANSNFDNPESSTDELVPTLIKKKKTHVQPRKWFRLSPSDYERVGILYKCTRCNKLYKRGQISKHVKHTHLKLPTRNFTCTYCDKTFHHISPFTKHKLEEHSIDDRLKCNVCDWVTCHTKSELTRHMNDCHMVREKVSCPDCDYVSFSRANLRKHAVRHTTVKNHHCKYCKKEFLRKSALTLHERIHTGDRRHVCKVCGRAFVQANALNYHMARLHPEVRDRYLSSDPLRLI